MSRYTEVSALNDRLRTAIEELRAEKSELLRAVIVVFGLDETYPDVTVEAGNGYRHTTPGTFQLSFDLLAAAKSVGASEALKKITSGRKR